MKKRIHIFYQEHRDLVRTGLGFLVAGFLYLILVLLTPFRIPCIFHLITGLSCPGCGISRFFTELAQLRILSAIRQNLAVAILLPLWGVVGLVEFWFNPKALAKGSRLVDILTWGSVVLLTVFGILRNLPGLEFLLPTL